MNFVDISKTKIKEWCAIDLRSLAIFRIGLALVILGDLFVRFSDLKAHYSDEGVLPRHVVIDKITDTWNISLHFISGTWQIQCVLFVLAALFAFMMLIGYKTRISTIISWFLMISVQSRNPVILQGGDIVLRVLLFWAMFLPLGACLSFDQKIKKRKYDSYQIISVASCALLLQVCFIYWFTALLKNDESWRVDGTAVWYALSIEQYATYLGLFMLNYPQLLKILTFLTLYLEAFGPFLAFSPFLTGPLRCTTAFMFIAFHLIGLNLTMELAHFSYICAVAWSLFIPKWFWDKILHLQQSQNIKNLYKSDFKASRFSHALASFFLAYIFLWNIRTLNIPFSYQEGAIGSLLHIDQYWNMFSPYPLKEDGWFVIPAILRDGTEVDLFNQGKAVSFKKPPLLSATYKNDRWRSYMMNLWLEGRDDLLLYYAKYLTIEWNKNHSVEKQALSFDIIFMWKTNNVEGPSLTHRKSLLWHHICF